MLNVTIASIRYATVYKLFVVVIRHLPPLAVRRLLCQPNHIVLPGLARHGSVSYQIENRGRGEGQGQGPRDVAFHLHTPMQNFIDLTIKNSPPEPSLNQN